MDNQWKEEYCGNCNFAVEWYSSVPLGETEEVRYGSCRKNPPSVADGQYPPVWVTHPACSQWREKGQ